MSLLQRLTRCLHASGFYLQADETIILYTKGPKLQTEVVAGTLLGHKTLVNESVRERSQAAYLRTPTGDVVISISPSSTLCINIFDKDEEEWNEDDTFPTSKLHPESKLAALTDSEGGRHVFFQNPSGGLDYLNDSAVSTIAPAEPQPGSPIAITVLDDNISVFYISATDGYLHRATLQSDRSWSDVVVFQSAPQHRLSQLMVSSNEKGDIVAYALTEEEEGRVLEIQDGKTLVLGKASRDGKFISDTTAENGYVPYFLQAQKNASDSHRGPNQQLGATKGGTVDGVKPKDKKPANNMNGNYAEDQGLAEGQF